MNALNEDKDSARLALKASRAKRIILWVMGFLILMPFLLLWFSGALRFK
ncbi:MAG: hypothetical protein ACNA77_09105 [Opitutales bacterium]